MISGATGPTIPTPSPSFRAKRLVLTFHSANDATEWIAALAGLVPSVGGKIWSIEVPPFPPYPIYLSDAGQLGIKWICVCLFGAG